MEVRPSVNLTVVGDTVTLSLSPPTALRSGSWAVGESLIITWLGEQQAVFPGYGGRASVDVLRGALTMRAVTVADSGVYVVQGMDPQLRASATITVVGKSEHIHQKFHKKFLEKNDRHTNIFTCINRQPFTITKRRLQFVLVGPIYISLLLKLVHFPKQWHCCLQNLGFSLMTFRVSTQPVCFASVEYYFQTAANFRFCIIVRNVLVGLQLLSSWWCKTGIRVDCNCLQTCVCFRISVFIFEMIVLTRFVSEVNYNRSLQLPLSTIIAFIQLSSGHPCLIVCFSSPLPDFSLPDKYFICLMSTFCLKTERENCSLLYDTVVIIILSLKDITYDNERGQGAAGSVKWPENPKLHVSKSSHWYFHRICSSGCGSSLIQGWSWCSNHITILSSILLRSFWMSEHQAQNKRSLLCASSMCECEDNIDQCRWLRHTRHLFPPLHCWGDYTLWCGWECVARQTAGEC